MAKDNRTVNVQVRTVVDDKENRRARVLGDDDVDEIAGMFSQDQLDNFVAEGYLAGDWTSTKSSTESAAAGMTDAGGQPKTDAKPISKMNRTELIAEVERLGLTAPGDEITVPQIREGLQAEIDRREQAANK